MQTYRVIWEIDIDAGSPVEAAILAYAIQRDHASIATVFDVIDESGVTNQVDLEEVHQAGQACLMQELSTIKGTNHDPSIQTN